MTLRAHARSVAPGSLRLPARIPPSPPLTKRNDTAGSCPQCGAWQLEAAEAHPTETLKVLKTFRVLLSWTIWLVQIFLAFLQRKRAGKAGASDRHQVFDLQRVNAGCTVAETAGGKVARICTKIQGIDKG